MISAGSPDGQYPTHNMIRTTAKYEILSTNPAVNDAQLEILVGDSPDNDGRMYITLQSPDGATQLRIADAGASSPEHHLFFTNIVLEAMNMALNDISLRPDAGPNGSPPTP